VIRQFICFKDPIYYYYYYYYYYTHTYTHITTRQRRGNWAEEEKGALGG